MILRKLLLCCAALAFAGPAFAQVELKTYADSDGYLDVQKLTSGEHVSGRRGLFGRLV